MLWIVALSAGWLSAFVLLVGMTMAAARSDRPTAEHLARRARARLWLPPQADGDSF
jgi:hypothetical protein